MMLALALAAVSIVFPREGDRLPSIARCYMIGSVEEGVTNLIVHGRAVEVHERGGWVTMIDCREGTNTVAVGETNVTFFVAPRSILQALKALTPPKVYEKLDYVGNEALPSPKGKRPEEITVVIDAGHGGKDAGARGPHGLEEKDANLKMAMAVKAELEARGFKVLMTRTDDRELELFERPRIAHEEKADAFISIHHNAPPLDKDPRLLRYHAVYAWNGIGEELARPINRRMAEAFGDTLKNNGVIHANFAVTRNPETPSCLIEVDFITSPEGEIDSWNRERRKRVAAAIAKGFADWAL